MLMLRHNYLPTNEKPVAYFLGSFAFGSSVPFEYGSPETESCGASALPWLIIDVSPFVLPAPVSAYFLELLPLHEIKANIAKDKIAGKIL